MCVGDEAILKFIYYLEIALPFTSFRVRNDADEGLNSRIGVREDEDYWRRVQGEENCIS